MDCQRAARVARSDAAPELSFVTEEQASAITSAASLLRPARSSLLSRFLSTTPQLNRQLSHRAIMLSQATPRACVRAALRARSTSISSAARLHSTSIARSVLRTRAAAAVATTNVRRALSSSPRSSSLIPDAEHPPPKESEASESIAGVQPTEISLSEYHEHADRYLEVLQQKLEDKQDAGEGVEVEYSVRSPSL